MIAASHWVATRLHSMDAVASSDALLHFMEGGQRRSASTGTVADVHEAANKKVKMHRALMKLSHSCAKRVRLAEKQEHILFEQAVTTFSKNHDGYFKNAKFLSDAVPHVQFLKLTASDRADLARRCMPAFRAIEATYG